MEGKKKSLLAYNVTYYGTSCKRLFPNVKFVIGPSIAEGFYYDFDIEKPFTDEDKTKIEEEMKKIIKEKYTN